MTLPNGAAGVNATGLPFLISALGNSATSVANLSGHDQATVIAAYKAKYITGGNSVFSNPAGPLGQLFGGFGGGGLIQVFASLVQNFLGVSGPFASIQQALNAIQKVPILSDLLAAITGSSTTGGGGIAGLTTFFTDFLGIFGHPTGLGTGSPTIPAVGSIPILGPLINRLISLFGGTGSGVTGLTAVLNDFMSLFGGSGLTGLGSGSPTLPGIGSIPILGGLLSGGTIKVGLLQPLIDAISTGFGGSTGLNFGGLQSFLTLIPGAQQLLDTIYHALTGDTSTGNPLSVITSLFSAFPSGKVSGVGGPANVPGTFQTLFDTLTGGLSLTTVSGTGFADLTAAATGIGSAVGSHTNILNIRNNQSVDRGLVSTIEAPFNIPQFAGSLPTIPVTNATAAMSFTRIKQDVVKTTVEWVGSGTTNVTGMVLSLFKMNPTTGDLTKLWTSSNLIGGVANTMSWNSYDIPAAAQALFSAGDVIGVEMATTGTGTYSLVGQASALPAHPTALPSLAGAVRNNGNALTAPSTISGGSIGYTANTPWLGLSVAGGVSYHTPVTTQYNTAGTYSYPVPPWAKYIDRIALGAGAGGSGGQSAFIPGFSGDPGIWVEDTIDLTATPVATLTVIAGAHGTGGPSGGTFSKPPGTNGAASSVSGSGVPTLTAAGGAIRTSGGVPGAGPGDITYLSQPYHGGATQNTQGGTGGAPGGGGAGGGSVWYFGLDGGPGADGSVWLVARVS